MSRVLIEDIPLLFLLVMFLVIGLIFKRGKKNRPVSAPRTNTAARITETIYMFSAGLIILIYLSCFKNGMLLKLNELRPAFAMTHVIIALIAAAFLLLAVFFTWIGRTSRAVILMTIVLFGYSTVIAKAPFEGPGYFMMKIAPKDSWVPIINYTFEVNSGLEGAEVWINGVLLGTTPFKITGDEFNKKVPFLTEPPEGFEKAPDGVPQEQWKRPEGNWFKVQIVGLEKRDNIAGQGISYLSGFKEYYAKIKYAGEWGKNSIGVSGGGGDFYQYNYTVSLSGHFSVTDKLEQERQERFSNLIQKARLSDYIVDQNWLETLDTYGDKGRRDIQNLTANEKKFSDILDKWVKWKYGISDDMTQKQADKILCDICGQVDKNGEYSRDSFESRAVTLLYDRLNVDDLIKKYEKLLKSGYTGNSISAIYHAIELWDKKLNEKDTDKLNIIERKITPELIIKDDIEKAAALGGPEIERYLLRQYERNTKIEGIDLGYENYVYTMGMNLNKWLYYLAFMKSPSAREVSRKKQAGNYETRGDND